MKRSTSRSAGGFKGEKSWGWLNASALPLAPSTQPRLWSFYPGTTLAHLPISLFPLPLLEFRPPSSSWLDATAASLWFLSRRPSLCPSIASANRLAHVTSRLRDLLCYHRCGQTRVLWSMGLERVREVMERPGSRCCSHPGVRRWRPGRMTPIPSLALPWPSEPAASEDRKGLP